MSVSSDKLALLFFALLFPIFFAYHSLIATGAIRPILPGGGWSVANAIGAVVLGSLLVRDLMTTGGAWRVHVPAAILAAWCAAYGLYYFKFGDTVQRDPALLMETGKLIIAWISLYCVGYFIRPTERAAQGLSLCLYAMAAVTLLFLESEPLNNPQPGGATYQWFATAVLFVATVCLAFLPKPQQPFVVAAAVSALFVLGSRSEFVAFLLVTTLWLATEASRREWRLALIGVLLAIFALDVAYRAAPYFPILTRSWTTENTAAAPSAAARHAEVVDLTNSASWQQRSRFRDNTIAAIRSAPIVGAYGSYLRDNNGALGTYGHDALSAWQQFGLIPFVLYVALTIAVPVAASWQVFVRRSDNAAWEWTLYVGAVTMLLITITKSIFWPLPALAWGLLARTQAGPPCR